MIAWILCSCVAPIVVFAIRFGLFTESGYVVTTDELGNVTNVTPTALNGWGIISCIIIAYTICQILNEVRDAYTGYSFKKQCIDGISKLLPLVAAIFICYFLKNVLEDLTYCLIVITICKLVAIPLNPLPKWKYEVRGEEDYNDLLTNAVNFIRTRFSGRGGDS